jgi:hypothetical protein
VQRFTAAGCLDGDIPIAHAVPGGTLIRFEEPWGRLSDLFRPYVGPDLALR